MVDDPDDPNIVADRLEAALERIAYAAAQPPAVVIELAQRLDNVIERLRSALAPQPD